MKTIFKSLPLCVFGALALLACGGSQQDNDQATQTAQAVPVETEQAALWNSQNPIGQVLQVQLPTYAEPVDATLRDDIVFTGDIAVGQMRSNQFVSAQELAAEQARASGGDREQPLGSGIVNAPNQRWPGGVIPYEFDPGASTATRNAFEGAKRDYDAKTVIRFVARTNQSDYVRVITGSGCYSYVGRIGGRQDLSLGNGCGVNPARHEMGHALGLAHEQVRQDRDQFVKVNLELTGGGRSQYEIDRGSAGTPIGAYDFESMMHYLNYQVNGRWIFEPKNGFPPAQIGNNRVNTFTPGDLQAIEAIYGAPGGGGGGAGVTLALDTWVSFKVLTPGFDNRFLRHQASQGFTEVVNTASADLLKQDASFKVVRAMDGTPCYSFQSRNFPNQYLRHAGWRLRIDASDGSNLFKQDATFCAQTGLAGKGGVSLVSRNYPGAYIRHYNAEVWLAKKGDPRASATPNQFEIDSSWELRGAWAAGPLQ
jgi:Alpha-L-arabinofuranosidase B (ABFB) domain/Astacin (Peptidase family M12A)